MELREVPRLARGRGRRALPPDRRAGGPGADRGDRGQPPVTVERLTVPARDVRVGDRVLAAGGIELTVTRIDTGMLGRTDLLAFVEDTEVRWLKLPRPLDAEVEV